MGEMKERMLRGELYIADDEDLAADFRRAQEILERYNRSAFAEQELRDGLLRELLGNAARACTSGRRSIWSTGRGSASAPARSSTTTA